MCRADGRAEKLQRLTMARGKDSSLALGVQAGKEPLWPNQGPIR
jgi:hypothetical protein